MKQSLVDGAIFQQLQQDDDRACVSASRGAQRKRSLRNTAAVVALLRSPLTHSPRGEGTPRCASEAEKGRQGAEQREGRRRRGTALLEHTVVAPAAHGAAHAW